MIHYFYWLLILPLFAGCGSSKSKHRQSQALAIDEFNVSPQQLLLPAGEEPGSVSVAWHARQAASCHLTVVASGEVFADRLAVDEINGILIKDATSIELRCVDGGGQEVIASKAIEVSRDAARPGSGAGILNLSVSPNPIYMFADTPAQRVQISWQTQGMKSCGLHVQPESGQAERLEGVDTTGFSESFRIHGPSSVTLICQTPEGIPISRQVQVAVNTVQPVAKCKAAEQHVYMIKNLNAIPLTFSSKEKRDEEYLRLKDTAECKASGCIPADMVRLSIDLEGKEAFSYHAHERDTRDAHLASLMASGFCSRPTRVSATVLSVSIDRRAVVYAVTNESRLEWILRIFKKNLPSPSKCAITSQDVAVNGRAAFYETDDLERWKILLDLEDSGFCASESPLGVNAQAILIDGQEAFFESNDQRRKEWLLELLKKDIVPAGSKCKVRSGSITIDGRQAFFISDERRRAELLEKLVRSGYCTASSKFGINNSYITVDGRKVFLEIDDEKRMEWLISLFKNSLFPAGSRCSANESYITIDGRNVFVKVDDWERARILEQLLTSGYCTKASAVSADYSYLMLNGQKVFSMADDEERLTSLMEAFQAGMGDSRSRCSANLRYVLIDRQEVFDEFGDAERFKMLLKLERSGFCTSPSKLGATKNAVTENGIATHVISDPQERLEKLLELFQAQDN